MAASQVDRPIFVIGCARSGTTLLQLMLHSHRRIAIPTETRFLLPAYEARRDFGALTEEANRRALAEWITGRKITKFHDLGLDTGEVVDEIVAGPPTLGSALGIVFGAYARRFGKPRWGDKRPAYIKYVDVLRRMWPNAQFVHLIRDGRDCAASLKEVSWYKLDVYHALATWWEAIDDGRRLAAELGPDGYYELRYERLVSEPETQLRGLCAFLGEDFDPAMTRPQRIAELTLPAKKRWHARTREDVGTGRVGSWARRLEPWEAGLAEAVLGSRLRRHGYELTGAPRPQAAQRAMFARVLMERRMVGYKRHLRDRWHRYREPGPVVSLLPGGPPAAGVVPGSTGPVDGDELFT